MCVYERIVQLCKSFKNIEDVWNFQLSDVKIESNYQVFMPSTKQEAGPTVGIAEPKKTFVKVSESASFFVRDLKLTTADNRLFLTREQIAKQRAQPRAGPGRPPKKPRTDAD